MKRIWAPWRIEYVAGESREKGCLFCNTLKDKADKKRLVIFRGEKTFVMMNKYPYIGGHLLVVPNKHVPSLSKLNADEKLELMEVTAQATETLKRTMKPDGFNIGINMGHAAGAGVPGHVHIHIVPRWSGDNNFMAVLGDVRMINEHLTRTYEKLKANWR